MTPPRSARQAWLAARELLTRSRAELGTTADGHYPGLPRVGGTSLLYRPEWLPDGPVPLANVRLEWVERAEPPAVSGREIDWLPAGLDSYAEAIAALAPPAVFENRPAYRLLTADLRDTMTLRMSETSYFAGVDVNEAVAHELAAQVPGLPLRTLLGDPRELSRRSATMAITTLTLRGADSFVLHWRDPRKVTHAGGLHQVMPVGVFQPGPSPRADFDLWHGMVREFSEEFLGGTEDYGPGFAYPGWPFYQRLQQARSIGGVRVHCLGLGVDPLTLAVDLLTVAAFEKDVFDELFHDLVEVNAEGTVSLAPFNGEIPAPMQPAGAAVLELAWRHRKAL